MLLFLVGCCLLVVGCLLLVLALVLLLLLVYQELLREREINCLVDVGSMRPPRIDVVIIGQFVFLEKRVGGGEKNGEKKKCMCSIILVRCS